MRITVLTVPDCPNAPVIEERIARALDSRNADVDLIEVVDHEQAARLGMTGSPTVLINGVDPFAMPGTPASLSCRLYRGTDGRADGAPSVSDLRKALHPADATADCECPPMGAAAKTDAAKPASPGRTLTCGKATPSPLFPVSPRSVLPHVA
ncbi:thioredoxin family protein [Streptomyces sp. NPDC004074]|uniref:thioredoxin family protein n=1 Tax=Streptomyces sp. NPDC004074 TaxID=3154277 RepID=UPI0033B2C1A2